MRVRAALLWLPALLRAAGATVPLGPGAERLLDALDIFLPPALLQNLESLVRAAPDVCSSLSVTGGDIHREARDGRGRWVLWARNADGALVGRAMCAARAARAAAGRRAALYAGGWGNSAADDAARATADALLRRHGAVLALDTRRAFGRPYAAAVHRVAGVARALAAMMRALRRRGEAARDMHVVGFSLGAHAAGAAARRLAARGARPGRLTTLDPARPCFVRGDAARLRLRRSDARFVQVVHGSSGALGFARPLGHVDVYVNGAAARRAACGGGARGLRCAHEAAWRALGGAGAAAARRCDDAPAALAARCSDSYTTVGFDMDESTRGIFLLEWKPSDTRHNDTYLFFPFH